MSLLVTKVFGIIRGISKVTQNPTDKLTHTSEIECRIVGNSKNTSRSEVKIYIDVRTRDNINAVDSIDRDGKPV